MSYTLNDYTAQFLSNYNAAILRALERIGLEAEGNAIELVPVDTSNLRQSITHKVDPSEKKVYVGSNEEYAAYVECGTGKYYDGSLGGSGHPGWWVYVKGSDRKKGDTGTGKVYTFQEAARVVAILRSKDLDAYMTEGQKPQPYLRPAAKDHMNTYRAILKDEVGGLK